MNALKKILNCSHSPLMKKAVGKILKISMIPMIQRKIVRETMVMERCKSMRRSKLKLKVYPPLKPA